MAVDNWSGAGLTTLAALWLPCTGGAALCFHKHGCMLGSLDDCSRTSMLVFPCDSCSAMCFSLLGAGNCHYCSLNGWDVSWTSGAGPVTFKCARFSAAGGIRKHLLLLLIQCRLTASPPSAAAQSGQAPLQSSRAAREVFQSTTLPSRGCVESSRAD